MVTPSERVPESSSGLPATPAVSGGALTTVDRTAPPPDTWHAAGQGNGVFMRPDSGDEQPEPVTGDDAGVDLLFAGDLFLALAAEGRLVLDAAQADRVIADLEHTIELVSAQLCRAELAWRLPLAAVRELLPATEGLITSAAFTEQVFPGQYERVLDELAKYVEAFKIAKATGAGLPPPGP
jgi:hypothetical protein